MSTHKRINDGKNCGVSMLCCCCCWWWRTAYKWLSCIDARIAVSVCSTSETCAQLRRSQSGK